MMMGWSFLALVVSLCFWTAYAHPAATTETLVVARADDSVTPKASEDEAPTTEGPMPSVELTQMDVRSEVALRYAHTAVVTKVRNPARRAQETTFHVLLPDTAFISGFTMTLDGKSYKAYVKEKEEAKNIYNAAVAQGVGTALVSAKARNSNHFTVSVNVEPNTVAIFNLTYEELLVRRNGVYHHALNLHPGALVPQLTVTVHIKEARPITTLRVPELRSGNEIDASENDAPNPNTTIVRSADDREATVSFSPDLDAQLRLMAVYKNYSSQHKNSFGFRPVERSNDHDGVLGQFVVQYDVDRSTNGDVLVNNGYFVHFFAPNLPPLPKHVVFVLDTSGSMHGRKIKQLKEAMVSILSELRPGDYFNIVEFETSVKVHDLSEADAAPTRQSGYSYYDTVPETALPVTLTCPSPATQSNIEKAKTIIQRLRVDGATNIYRALDTAIDIVNRGTNASAGGACANGQASNDLVSTTPASSADHQRPEPMIIFLTDGEANVEVSNTEQIIRHVTERNTGDHKAAIFSLAFGEDAHPDFLRKLSLRNSGFMRHIYEAADAALQLRDFYRQVASPLLADVRFTYPPEQVKESSLTTHTMSSYYKGSEIVVAGQLVPDQTIDFETCVEGFGITDDSRKKKAYRLTQRAGAGTGDLPLERLWAYLTIKQLLDKRDAADADRDKDALKQTALSIALQYSFVTPLTSLVVVKPNATSAVDAESVDRPEYASLLPTRGALSGYGTNYGLMSAQQSSFNSAQYAPMLDTNGMAPGSGTAYGMFPPPQASFNSAQYAPMLDTNGMAPGSGTAYGMMPPQQASFNSGRGPPTSEAAIFPIDLTRGSARPTLTSTASAPITPSPLAAYRLEEFPWARDLIDATSDTLRLRFGNGTELTLRLARDEKDEPAATGAACAPSAAGGDGICTYLRRCEAARALTVQHYQTLYCDRDGYAGVCCPTTTNTSQPEGNEKS